jgi:hypothetical protein
VEAEEEWEELEELLVLWLLLWLLLLPLLLLPPPDESVFSATSSSILSNRSTLWRPEVRLTTVRPSGVVSRRYSVIDCGRGREGGREGRKGGREGGSLVGIGWLDA